VQTLTHRDVQELLGELAERLNASGVTAQINIIGGATVGFYVKRSATLDIDATFRPSGEISEVVHAMARERGLPEDWLNERAKGFIPFNNQDEFEIVLEQGTVTISIAQPRLLLAMKLRANRGPRDVPDVLALIAVCGLRSYEQVARLYEDYHAQEVMAYPMEMRVRDYFRPGEGQG
jgi:hypothetical protein